MEISKNESENKSISSMAESLESREILFSSSESKTGSDKLFVGYLNCDCEIKMRKQINSYLDLFLNIHFKNISFRFCLTSQPNNKLISNNEQILHATDLLPLTFSTISSPTPCGKNLTNSQINVLSKYY